MCVCVCKGVRGRENDEASVMFISRESKQRPKLFFILFLSPFGSLMLLGNKRPMKAIPGYFVSSSGYT